MSPGNVIGNYSCSRALGMKGFLSRRLDRDLVFSFVPRYPVRSAAKGCPAFDFAKEWARVAPRVDHAPCRQGDPSGRGGLRFSRPVSIILRPTGAESADAACVAERFRASFAS
jgi:hypothetical protein